MTRATTIIWTLAAAAFAASGARAQDLTVKAPPQRGPIVVTGATVHVGDGRVLEDGALWFADGRIGGVGASAEDAGAPADAEVVDGSGLHLWPGMISAVTRVGLSEIGSVPATQDYREIGEFSPEAYAAVAVNPDASTIPVTRSNGVLTVGVFPSGGSIPGRASVLQLEGWTTEDMTIRADAGLIVAWPAKPTPGQARGRRGRSDAGDDDERDSTAARRDAIDRMFADARAWTDSKRADPGLATDVRFAAMARALDRSRPVFLLADDVESIRSAVGWALDRELRPVLVGGREADLCAAFLRERDVPVVVLGTHRLPTRRDDPHDRPFRLPAELHAAGVRFCIAGDGGYANERNLPYHAGKAVAYGLPLEVAERAVTIRAAEILDVGDDLGSLEPGKRATLILTDGHPLEITTQVRAAWISGRRTDLTNKQTRLARKYEEKYRQLGLWPEPGRDGR